jgi:signal recognition particle receptor subunit beta
MAYFMKDVERICAAEYEPTDQDVLRCRVKTTGLSSIEFTFNKVQFRMFDVGGQRSERKKWIHCFDNVTAIMFVVSIAGYDQVLEEDGTTNRMQESMVLFEDIANNQYFKRKSFIVFFNKKDLFEQKIRDNSIKEFFPHYNGDEHSFTESSEFLVKEYLSRNHSECTERSMYPHLTTAKDT